MWLSQIRNVIRLETGLSFWAHNLIKLLFWYEKLLMHKLPIWSRLENFVELPPTIISYISGPNHFNIEHWMRCVNFKSSVSVCTNMIFPENDWLFDYNLRSLIRIYSLFFHRFQLHWKWKGLPYRSKCLLTSENKQNCEIFISIDRKRPNLWFYELTK